MERILIAGVGNIFLGDDAFGVEVVHRLAHRLPESVRVTDFGIRGIDLAYALADGYQATILVDTVSRNGAPGTIYVIEPDLSSLDAETPCIDGHSLDPIKVLALVHSLGGEFKHVIVVGCEPQSFGDAEAGRLGLSEPVAAAVEEAAAMIESLVERMLAEQKEVAARVGPTQDRPIQTVQTGEST